ncbi:pseudaminic acid cytidylyltransferase [Desulfopila sp. IMCC35008]|uniref:pseudaminic acid cytidylyltransferase n=1 Tax=Desulfopila sp. IMCC35008 TaxID=2653858 RepID=UPI0013D1D2D3|nr:pseudaminic acid cytidylyltransferase [Desulfopila sp. IMCC35008]
MNIAIIPARGGSKRIPRKNIRSFYGKPMISYAIDCARESGLFEHVVVSTEDHEIAEIAQDCGAEVPFFRPEQLADDHTTTVKVVEHGIQMCCDLGWKIKYVCCIYPCTPFIRKEDLKGAFDLLVKRDGKFCFPVTRFPSAVQRSLRLTVDGKVEPFFKEYVQTRTQDLEVLFHDTGQFYWGNCEAWLHNDCIHSEGIGYEIPQWRVIDIDEEADWNRAEKLYQVITHK